AGGVPPACLPASPASCFLPLPSWLLPPDHSPPLSSNTTEERESHAPSSRISVKAGVAIGAHQFGGSRAACDRPVSATGHVAQFSFQNLVSKPCSYARGGIPSPRQASHIPWQWVSDHDEDVLRGRELRFPGLVQGGAIVIPGPSALTIPGHDHEEPLPPGYFGEDLGGTGSWGRSPDLLRPDDYVGPFVASYPHSTILSASFGPPPSYTNIYGPSFPLTEWALPPTTISTFASPGVSYPAQFRPPNLPTPAVQLSALSAVPVQTPLPGLQPAINPRFNFQQAALNSQLDDRNVDFNFESLLDVNDPILDLGQLARGPEFQHSSPTSDPSSPTTGTGTRPHSAAHTTSSLASSSYGSSPTPIHKTNSKPGIRDSFFCRQCPKTFDDRSRFRRHVRDHEKSHGCSLAGCKKRFSTKQDLERHKKTIKHGGRRRFQCSRCQKVYVRKDYLQRHEKKVHNVD
ncbi:hypothetical protein B0I37DRAFT_407524, partial [Chaetomium sp. MPI-CAGE-AT-0009]